MDKDLNNRAFETVLCLSMLGELQTDINNRFNVLLEQLETKFNIDMEADEELKKEKSQIIQLQKQVLMKRKITNVVFNNFIEMYKKYKNKEE